jgi:4-hydroxy-tetrahydrodipicolinate synthase
VRKRLFDPATLRTVHLVPLTAFDRHGGLDLSAQAEHVAALSAAGVRVFLPAAGTGEFHSLSPEEIVRVVQVTREAAGADALIFAPVGGPIGQALEVGRRSLAAGADGVMFMPFLHPYLSDAGARLYYMELLQGLDAPSLIYKTVPIPSDRLLLELSRDPRIVGIKYATNDLHAVRAVIQASEGACVWLCGSAERFAPYFMLAGCGGYTSGAGNLCPRLTLAMHAAFSSGNTPEVFRLQRLILPIEEYRAREGESFGISMLKYGLSLMNKDFGDPRPPQRRLTAEERAEIRSLVRTIAAAEARL